MKFFFSVHLSTKLWFINSFLYLIGPNPDLHREKNMRIRNPAKILFYFIYKLLYLLITMIKCTFLVSARAARSWKCNQTEFFLRVFKYPSKLYTISTPLPLLIAIPLWGLPADVGIPQLSLQTSGLWSLSSTYPRYLSEFCSIWFAIAALSSITSFWVACKT